MMDMPGHVKPIVSIGRLLHCWGVWEDYDWLIVQAMEVSTRSWEIGDAAGVYMVADIKEGRSASVNIRINDKAYLGDKADTAHQAMIDYVFEGFGLIRMESRVPAHLHGAIKFNKRLGFEFEGMIRRAGVVNGQPSDVWLGAIIRDKNDA